MTLGATLVTSLLATLAHPTTWMLALAGFLVRGGIVIFLLPIVVLPSPVGLANATGPTVVGFVLGGFTFDLVVLLGLVVGAVVAWIVFGGLLAAALEVEGIRIVAARRGRGRLEPVDGRRDRAVPHAPLEAPPPHAFDPSRQAMRVLAARIALLLPLLATVIWASARTVAVTYAELTVPSDVTIPIVWRIVAGVPDAIAIVVIVWVVGRDRRRDRRPADRPRWRLDRRWALGRRHVRRRPSASDAWCCSASRRPGCCSSSSRREPQRASRGRAFGGALADRDALAGAVALLVFVALWAGGLALAGAAAAWRHAAWTVDAVTHGHRTFGGSTAGHPGDWNTEGRSGTV